MDTNSLTNREAVEPQERLDAYKIGTEILRVAVIALQFWLLILVIRQFEIESNAFQQLAALGFGGFLVHHFLPARFRLPFFACLSIAGIALVLGPANCAWILVLGCTLIGIAHLPVAFRWRIVIMLTAMAILVALRAQWIASPWSAAIWPILGSMFMFRMIIYMYDLSKKSAPAGIWWSLSYFFMLPNVCFPLFPVVDYKSFHRSHFNQKNQFRAYQTGIQWMFRGLFHLILYRLITQNFVLSEASIEGAGQAAQYIVATYLLYLYISGSFAFIVGLLHMFGFNLHDTHHNFLLASSLTDFWRRINIYWKEFIEKIFFRPAFYGLSKRFGTSRAMALAILYAFAFTWFLHSVQWFWIRGDFPVTWQDATFWGLLAILLILSALYESRYGRKRSLTKTRLRAASELWLAVRTMATFAFISLLWSLWNVVDYASLKIVMTELLEMTATQTLWIIGGLCGIGVIAVVVNRIELQLAGAARTAEPETMLLPYWRPALAIIIMSSAALVIARHPHRLVEPVLISAVDHVQDRDWLSKRDAELLQRGYYEDLTDATRYNRQLASLYAGKPIDWNVNRSQVKTDEFPFFELAPSMSVEFNGARWTTNRWGMRDREYDKLPAPGTLRIAVLGASNTAGLGVNDGETYESLVEEMLNARDAGGGMQKYEVLNFSVPGYGPFRSLAHLQNRVFEFKPDILINVRASDSSWVINDLLRGGKTSRFPQARVQEVLASENIDANTPEVIIKHRLRSHADDLDSWVYRQIVEECRRRGIRPMFVFLPTPSSGLNSAEVEKQINLARDAGFEIIDMSGTFDAVDQETLWVASWDRHPNAEAHRMLAENFYQGLRELLLKPNPVTNSME